MYFCCGPCTIITVIPGDMSRIQCTLFTQSFVHLLTTLLFPSLLTIYDMPAHLVTTLPFHCDLQDVLTEVPC
jgi:hypothetical protein